RAQGLDWIEDPANADPAYARSRARAALAAGRPVRPDSPPPARSTGVAWSATDGGLVVERASLARVEAAQARRFLSAALLSASGQDRPPRGARLEALRSRLAADGAVSATLAGARVIAGDDEILLTREAPRGGLSLLPLHPAIVSVWDGRFEIAVKQEGYAVAPAAGRMARLSPADRKQLQGIPPAARGVQPVLLRLDTNGSETRPVLAGHRANVRPLAADRLAAALGLTVHERDIASGLVAPEGRSSYVG
ncbi:MAG: PP-loop family protein, partial [Caulobacteraceae bacterium]|nr:PP-loop family protein [Caulobacteraceae bacterium]